MKLFALIAAALASICFGIALWWFVLAWRLYYSDAYMPEALSSVWRYGAGPEAGDGSGIFMPAGLVFAVGLFLARYAWNLWHDGR